MNDDKNREIGTHFYELFCNNAPVSIQQDDFGDIVLSIGDFSIDLDKFDFGLMMEKMDEISKAASIFLDVLNSGE